MSDLLVDADWLEARLEDPTVRVIDTRVTIVPQPPGPSDYVSLYPDYLASHIPGAGYLHMVEDLSDPDGAFPFALPSPEVIWQRLGDLGIRSSDTIVLYGNHIHFATHRCWWVLAVAGADVRLLNATFANWVAEGRPLASGAESFEAVTFDATPRTEWVASKADVIASMTDPDTTALNALSAEQHAGRGQPFGRPGRIPKSLSLPAAAMMQPDSGAFRSVDEIARALGETGVSKSDQLITYCGGGIAASTTFVALRLLGYENLSLYDGSLLEWSADPDLPLVID
ncbi:sulfurtransferase [Sneathiella marina]|uniref:Sulfurtransferase n=1 Tax=Sneathiella marina TaxID=2950108 RepID=A0ABY4VZH1_9PROT|nr:sulfurtransferase [Sneathiella marina]USG60016.1 sulfurtransferase [Sneathiella marina]